MTPIFASGVLSGAGSFGTGLQHLTDYLGNLILPVVSGLCLVLAVRAYMAQMDGQRYIIGAVAALLASSFARLLGDFTAHGNSANSYYYALVALTDWLANWLMPTLAGLEFARAALTYSGAFEKVHRGQGYGRHILAGILCFSLSGILHLLILFVTTNS